MTKEGMPPCYLFYYKLFIFFMKKNVFLFLALMLLFSMKGFADDYKFTSHAEIQSFVNAVPFGTQYDADNLYVTGSDVSQQDIDDLQACFSSVNVKLTFKDLTYPGDGNNDGSDAVVHFDNFLDAVEQNGGIVITNCPNLDFYGGGSAGFIGAGKIPKHVKGDLILDSIPIPFPGFQGWPGNQSFGDIEEVDGDLIIGSRYGNQQFMGGFWDDTHTTYTDGSFEKLQRVGGSFRLYMTGRPWIWDIPAPALTYIGGDFEMRGPSEREEGGKTILAGQFYDSGSISVDNPTGMVNLAVWSLIILQNVTDIGGDVTIVNCPNIQIGQSGDWGGTGYCYLRYLIDMGYIDYYNCHNVTLGMENDPLDLSSFGGCLWGSGDEQDDPSTPDRDPSCAPSAIPAVQQPVNNFATVQPTYVQDNLTIESATGLAKVDVIDITGRIVKTFPDVASGKNSLPLSNLSNGIYLVRMVGVNNEMQTVKIVKQ